MARPSQSHISRRSSVEIVVLRYFGRRMVYSWQLPGIMRKHIYTGALGSIWGTLISGMFFVYFGNRLGMTPYQWGLLGGVVSWVLCAEMLSAVATQRLRLRKLIWFSCAAMDRGLRFLGIGAAMLLWRAGWDHAVWLLIATTTLANLFGAMANTPWFSWLADIIPEEVQGAFWGRRSLWIALAVAAVSLPAGLLMDRVDESGKLSLAMWVFIVATVLGLVDLIIHRTIPEPRMARQPERPVLQEILTPFRDPGFRPWLRFVFGWTVSVMLGGTLAVVYSVENLRLKDSFLGGTLALVIIPLVGSMATTTWTGRMVDAHGPKRVLFWGHLAWSLVMIPWTLATPGTAVYWVGLAGAVGGAAVTAASNAGLKLTTRFPPPERRAMYIAASNTTAYIASGIGSIAAGVFIRAFGDLKWSLAGLDMNGFHLLFIVSLVLRLLTLPVLLARVQNPPVRRLVEPAAA